MADQLIQVDHDFWNIRGSFRIGGVVDIGTQASLIRLQSGRFILLDSYGLKGKVRDAVMALTDQGRAVEAILNLHPFHTVHCEQMHRDFPGAALYGSDRHVKLFPNLPWRDLRVDDPELHAQFEGELEFSIPRGVDFISDNDAIHFSSVMAYHVPSLALHVDDTLMVMNMPAPLKLVGIPYRLSFHPTLAQALEKRAGATEDFDVWASDIATRWGSAAHICAAHTGAKLNLSEGEAGEAIRYALKRTRPTLAKHKRKYG